MPTVYARSFQVAAELLGGVKSLSDHLGVEEHRVRLWMTGKATPPTSVFLLAVDIVNTRQLNARPADPRDE